MYMHETDFRMRVVTCWRVSCIYMRKEGPMRKHLFALLVCAPSSVIAQTPQTLVALRGAGMVSISRHSAIASAGHFGPVDLAPLTERKAAGAASKAPSEPPSGAMTAADLARAVSTPGAVWTQDQRVALLAAGGQ
jgi:hypothetical protein